MIQNKLKELGFSEREVKVYLALIELGTAVASEIAKKARVNRSTSYVILESLAGRGLVSTTDRQGVRLYNSTSPEQLVQYLEGMSKRYAGMADTAKELVPELAQSRIHNVQTAPKVQLFEGPEGIKTVYEDTLATLEEMRVYASFGSKGVAHDESLAGHANKPEMRVQKVFLDTLKDQKRVLSSKEHAQEELITLHGKKSFSSEINIYDDRVIFISPAENFALVVESHELADVLKNAFGDSKHGRKKLPDALSETARFLDGLAPA